MTKQGPILRSQDVQPEIEQILLSGRASTASEAESIYLDEHLEEIAELAVVLNDRELRDHEAVKLLVSHGSRSWEDGRL